MHFLFLFVKQSKQGLFHTKTNIIHKLGREPFPAFKMEFDYQITERAATSISFLKKLTVV